MNVPWSNDWIRRQARKEALTSTYGRAGDENRTRVLSLGNT
jgi:hypothetical protein